FGARPLKRAIQQELENPLAQQILSGKLLPNKAVTVDYQNGQIVATQ
ncbi:TPA: molecular chaperone, partial [Mannheimia haemolytica]|nr:molecular chaperone [Mannheimia haemolytica]